MFNKLRKIVQEIKSVQDLNGCIIDYYVVRLESYG
ncbi:hypothetical protein C3B55_00067 [Candidatus Pseudomonas adelgestsugas]|uniref:Uncharacterized protein n=1 Tax=Candidatus Pseudomonas adelgestsugas TaxID=1302376 RepID=A0ABX5R817_9PSED|nr:hypothetical protein C3B55_00067 [Candidatus Pseudomonas adelgestsugas]